MNFQAVKQANGNNITMFGTFVEIGGVSLTQNQKQVCKCQIVDDNNEKHDVRLYGTMPGVALLNQRQQFNISTFQSAYQGAPYTGYSGFWNNKVQVAPQNIQQAPSQATQATNYQQPAPRKKEPDWDAISRGKVRHGVVCAYIQSGSSLELDVIERWVNYIMTGIDPASVPDPDPGITNPNYEENPPPPTDSEIPF